MQLIGNALCAALLAWKETTGALADRLLGARCGVCWERARAMELHMLVEHAGDL